ncbi:MAG: TetR family transcriptional regulator [Candidatus Dormibacteraeota bacterium]|nr:TetR family transcriptional regulator [Candidatus Dormibacteraeota bacterium]
MAEEGAPPAVPSPEEAAPAEPVPLRVARILDAATALFAEHGYDGASMRVLAARAGCSPANLYYHYRGKYELFVTLIEQAMQLHLMGLRRALELHADPVDQLRYVLTFHLRLHMERREVRLLRSDFHPLQGAELERFMAARDEYEHGVRAIAAQARDLGLASVEDPRLAVMVALTACSQVDTWYRADGELSSAELSRRIADLLLAAFGIDEARRRAPLPDPSL